MKKQSTVKSDEISTQICSQYLQSIQTLELLDKWQKNTEFEKATDLETIQHNVIEWNFFLQDLMKGVGIEIPERIE